MISHLRMKIDNPLPATGPGSSAKWEKQDYLRIVSSRREIRSIS
jgi:hypothetical protein